MLRPAGAERSDQLLVRCLRRRSVNHGRHLVVATGQLVELAEEHVLNHFFEEA